MVSNLFRLERAPNFHLFQYRVDFNPEVPSKGMRKSMLKEHVDLIGAIYQFDGMTLFLPIRLEKDVRSVRLPSLASFFKFDSNIVFKVALVLGDSIESFFFCRRYG